MAKFKVGDRVILIQDCCTFTGLKKGEKGTVKEESEVPFVKWDNPKFNKGSNDMWAVSQNKLALLPEQSKALPSPQKSLLQSGDKVVYRNGGERYVLLETNCMYTLSGQKALEMVYFNEDLIYCDPNDDGDNVERLDIVKVYRNDQLIMERPEVEREFDLSEMLQYLLEEDKDATFCKVGEEILKFKLPSNFHTAKYKLVK